MMIDILPTDPFAIPISPWIVFIFDSSKLSAYDGVAPTLPPYAHLWSRIEIPPFNAVRDDVPCLASVSSTQ